MSDQDEQPPAVPVGQALQQLLQLESQEATQASQQPPQQLLQGWFGSREQ